MRTEAGYELAIAGYIGWYNHDRIHRALGGRTLAEINHDYRATRTVHTTKT